MSDEPSDRKEQALNRQLIEQNLALQRKLGRFETLLDNYRFRASILLAVVVFVAVLLSFYPRALFYSQNVFNPTRIPADYVTVNNYVTKTAGDSRIMWVPFIDPSHMYYQWAPEKRISPFNVWSSNPSLNNMQEGYNADSYFVWLADLLQTQQFSAEQLVNKDLTLPRDIASRLFIPFAARYMIFDSSILGYNFGDYFDRDGSLTKTFNTNILTVYQPDYFPPLIRVADKTVKADSFYDDLAISSKFSAAQMGRIAFVNQKPVTPSFASVGPRFGLLDLKDYTGYEAINGSFEGGDVRNRATFQWFTEGNPSYITLSQDPGHHTDGMVSLMAVNNSTKQFDIGWEKSDTISVQQGQVYTFQTSVRTRNTVWTNAVLEGYKDDTKQWVQLLQSPSIAPSSSGWNKYRCSICIPAGISSIRAALAAGWAQDPHKGPAVSWFDDVKIGRVEDRFYSDLFAPVSSPEVTFKKVTGEKYVVHVKNAAGPFLLVFGEAFDPFWVATTPDGRAYQPAPLYSTINGFQIDKPGDYDLTIAYQPQAWYTGGRVIAVAIVILCLIFLVYDWRLRGKGKVLPFLKRVMGGAGRAGIAVVVGIKGPPRKGSY